MITPTLNESDFKSIRTTLFAGGTVCAVLCAFLAAFILLSIATPSTTFEVKEPKLQSVNPEPSAQVATNEWVSHDVRSMQYVWNVLQREWPHLTYEVHNVSDNRFKNVPMMSVEPENEALRCKAWFMSSGGYSLSEYVLCRPA